MSALFPLFLKLNGKRVVVVGDTPKAQTLRDAGAQVVVVAPEAFTESHLDGAWLVVAAAKTDVNARVSALADARQIFCNAIDDVEASSAYMGGIVRRGGTTVAISTDGAAPALAGLLREALESVLPEELGMWLDIARQERGRWKGVEMSKRRPLLLKALNEAYR